MIHVRRIPSCVRCTRRIVRTTPSAGRLCQLVEGTSALWSAGKAPIRAVTPKKGSPVNEPSFPLPGTIITYVDPDATGSALFCRAVSDGSAILDPATGDLWLPARTPDRAPVPMDPFLV